MPPTIEFAFDNSFGCTDEPYVFSCNDLWQHDEPLLDVLASRYGAQPLTSFGGSYGWSVRYRQEEDYAAIGLKTMAEYIEAFRSNSVQLPYLRHLSVNRAMPELRRHIRHPQEFGPNWADFRWLDRYSGPEIFIGQENTGFGNFHQDHASVHVGFVQLEGSKEFTLFRPEDGEHLYRMQGAQFPFQMRNSAVRLEEIDSYARFPNLRYATPRKITLSAGQALFLPADWWHTTRNLTDSVSYSVRIVNGSNIGALIARHVEGLGKLV